MARPPAPPCQWIKDGTGITLRSSITHITANMLFGVTTKATSGNLSAQECSGVQFNNIGQSANVTMVLPTAAAGLHGSFVAGTTAAFYYRYDPQATDKIYLDGAALTDGYYVGFASIAIGNCLTFWAFESATGVYDWYFATGSGDLQAQA